MDPPSTEDTQATEITASTHSIDQINPIPKDDEHKTNNVPWLSPGFVGRGPPNLPWNKLLQSREDYHKICAPLFEASIIGDWKVAKEILDKDPEVVRCSITENGDTALHIAASATSSKLVEEFVINILHLMTQEDLELENENYNTAFCLAASHGNGNVNVVDTMLKKNSRLLTIAGGGWEMKMMPLYMASLNGNGDMVTYLYNKSCNLHDEGWTPTNRGWLLEKCVEADLFEVALNILKEWPELAANGVVLQILARKTHAFEGRKRHFIWGVLSQIFAVIHVKVVEPTEIQSDAMQLLKLLWTNISTKLSKNEIDKIMRGPPDPIPGVSTPHTPQLKWYSSRILFVAAEMGNTEFVVELIRQYPDLIWKVNDKNQTIFHVAVIHRHLGIYNLLYEIGSMKDMITPLSDFNGDNILHLVGRKSKRKRLQSTSGMALILQEELLWFKEVRSIMPPPYRETVNKDGLRPHELFVEEHRGLTLAIEEWMKAAANQCLVVATLIASIGFAAAFTVPGGYNQNDGIPMFLHKRSFIIFIISDGISLAFSSISILVFLSFFTSISAEPDYVQTLTKKLSRGLATLFLSITAMLVAFIVNLFVIYQDSMIWVPIFMSILISIPVILYARLQSELLVDVYRSSYGSKNIFKRKKKVLFNKNPKF